MCLTFGLDLGIFLNSKGGEEGFFHISRLYFKELSKKGTRLDTACHDCPTHCNYLPCFRNNELTTRSFFHPQHACGRNKPLCNKSRHVFLRLIWKDKRCFWKITDIFASFLIKCEIDSKVFYLNNSIDFCLAQISPWGLWTN